MIEQPQAPKVQHSEQHSEQAQNSLNSQLDRAQIHTGQNTSEFEVLLREVKQLRQDVQFLKQLLEHVQKDLR